MMPTYQPESSKHAALQRFHWPAGSRRIEAYSHQNYTWDRGSDALEELCVPRIPAFITAGINIAFILMRYIQKSPKGVLESHIFCSLSAYKIEVLMCVTQSYETRNIRSPPACCRICDDGQRCISVTPEIQGKSLLSDSSESQNRLLMCTVCTVGFATELRTSNNEDATYSDEQEHHAKCHPDLAKDPLPRHQRNQRRRLPRLSRS